MALEKSVLGFYVSNHPLRDVEQVFSSYVTLDSQSIRNAGDKTQGLFGGLVSKVRPMTTKSGPNAGKRWAILMIEDLVGSLEVVIYSNEFEKFGELLKPDTVLIFDGFVDKTREEPCFKAKEVMTLEQAQKTKTREIVVATNSIKLDDSCLAKVGEILAAHKGRTPVKLEVCDLAVTPAVRVQMLVSGGLNITNGGVKALQDVFGESAVLAMGPNRKARRAAPRAESHTAAPSDELELVEA
jgi:DNA polymerase-3 subunit alpha